MRASAAALLAGFLLLASPSATGAEADDVRLSLDPYVSLETGPDFTRTSVSLFGFLEARASRPFERSRATGIAFRFTRTVFLDLPMAWWFGVLEHEAFGHGGRAREFGASATFHMGSPWGGRDSYAGYTTEGLGTDDLLRIAAGGTESNGWTATQLERDLVSGRRMRPFELLFLVANRWVDYAYVVRTTPDPSTDPAGFYAEWAGGGDVANYLGRLSEQFTGDPGITQAGSTPLVRENYQTLRRQSIWNVLDPGLWLSLWTAGRSVATGEEFPRVPLPRIRGRDFLPVLSADWLPDGGVASLELVAGPAKSVGVPSAADWSSVVVRRGTGPGGAFWAGGAAKEVLHEFPSFHVGGEVEAWTRPGRSPGGGARLRFTSTRGLFQRFFAELGLKSAGHWPGRPAEPGPFVRIGVKVPLGATTGTSVQ